MTAKECSKKNKLEKTEGKDYANISGAVKKGKARRSTAPHEHTSDETVLSQLIDKKLDKACISNYQFIGNEKDRGTH